MFDHEEKAGEARSRRRAVVAGASALLLVVAALALAGGGGSIFGTRAAPIGWSVAPYAGGPRLAVDQTIIDHGQVPWDHTVAATFHLRNVGDRVLTIQPPSAEIIAGCCAPNPILARTTLVPGEETTLSVQYTMHRPSGGPHRFAVTVESDDPVQPAQTLTVAAVYPQS